MRYARDGIGVPACALMLMLSMSARVSPAAADGMENRRSSCGYGDMSSSTRIYPSGGGDTVGIGGSARIYDSASPVSLANHDRVMLFGRPDRVRRIRSGDHLILCNDAERIEVVIENQYCRGPGILSDTDTPNNEIEEILFPEAREVWLTDILYRKSRQPALRWDPSGSNGDAISNGPPGADVERKGEAKSRKPWRVRPFSAVLPQWQRPSGACRKP